MKKLIVLFVLWFNFSFGGNPAETIKLGNTLYSEQNYVEALAQYHVLADSGWLSPALFYNMGNCYYRLGKNGYAILYYEKALALSPDDLDIQNNLTTALKNRIDEFEVVPIPVLKKISLSIINFFTATVWSVLGLVFVFLASIVIIVFLKSKKKSTFQFSLYVFFGMLGLLILFMAYQKNSFDQQHNYGILVIDNAYVKSAPESGEDLFIIHEGTKAQIEEVFNQWIKIRFPDGNSGWLESEGFEEI